MASVSSLSVFCRGATAPGSALASTSRLVSASAFSTSARSSADEDLTGSKPQGADDATFVPRGRKTAGRGRPQMLPPFNQWIKSDAMAFKYPKPGMGPNWIGSTPFPLNPNFKPPPPVRQSTRSEIWRTHASNPAQWTVRALAEKYSISIPRMEAILRLKAVELEWEKENKVLQSDFQSNMDRLLGAQDRTRQPENEPAVQTKEGSMRGVQHEEFPDDGKLDTPSVLGPALALELEAREERLKSLRTGGPDASATGKPKLIQPSKSYRPRLQVVNVAGDSYSGAGTVERNKRRAAKLLLKRSSPEYLARKAALEAAGTSDAQTATQTQTQSTTPSPWRKEGSKSKGSKGSSGTRKKKRDLRYTVGDPRYNPNRNAKQTPSSESQ